MVGIVIAIGMLVLTFVNLANSPAIEPEYAFVAPDGMELYGCFDLPDDNMTTCQWLCRSGDRVQTCTPEKLPLIPLNLGRDSR